MSIRFSCSCGKAFRAQVSAAGKRVKCPQCGSVLVVPQSPQQDEPATEEDPGHQPPEPTHARQPGSPFAEAVAAPPLPPVPASEEPGRAKQARPVLDEQAKQLARQRYQHLAAEKAPTNLLEYGYWLLVLTFIPLAFSLLQESKEDTLDRLVRSIEKSMPPREEKAPSKQKRAPKEKKAVPIVTEEPLLPEVGIDELIARLPDGRIEGAHLPRQTSRHWLYALLAGGVYLALTLVLFPGAERALALLGLGVFTATLGTLLLLLAQVLAEWTQGRILISGNVVLLLLYWIAWAIGFSYRAAIDRDVGLVPSLLGFTFGVGFCEEVCKALPLLWYYRVRGALPWRTACAWGFASGVGFGISEGITYSADFYNGIAPGNLYLVRFISCVALHGTWSAAAALFIHRFQHFLQADLAWHDYIPRALFLVGIPMLLHGLYDTFLKRDLNVLALLTALVSFAWFAWSVEWTRKVEEAPAMTLGRA